MDFTLSKLTDLTDLQIDYKKFKNGSFYRQLIENKSQSMKDYFVIRNEDNKILVVYQIVKEVEKERLVLSNLSVHEDTPKCKMIKELIDTLSILYPTCSINVVCKDEEMTDIYKKFGFKSMSEKCMGVQSFMERRKLNLR